MSLEQGGKNHSAIRAYQPGSYRLPRSMSMKRRGRRRCHLTANDTSIPRAGLSPPRPSSSRARGAPHALFMMRRSRWLDEVTRAAVCSSPRVRSICRVRQLSGNMQRLSKARIQETWSSRDRGGDRRDTHTDVNYEGTTKLWRHDYTTI